MKCATGALLVICFVGLEVRAVEGQSADTLRYSEVTDGEMVLSTPRGDVAIGSEHVALIGFVKIRSDSAHAWYEDISVASISPMGEERPDLSSVRGDLFILHFDAKGYVNAIRTPDFPASLEGITDLRYQFVDFFMPTPASPLRVGLTWSDTLIVDENRGDGVGGSTTKIATYRVVSDTIVASTPAFVIEGDGKIEVWTEGPVEGQPGLTMRMTLTGPEQNRFVVAKAGGDLLLRLRSAELKGAMEYLGAPQPIKMGVTRTYTNRIELRSGQGSKGGAADNKPLAPARPAAAPENQFLARERNGLSSLWFSNAEGVRLHTARGNVVSG